MKKKIIISCCILISLLASLTNNEDVFLTDSKNLINVLLTILGLCFSSFSIISISIENITKKSDNKNLDKKVEKFIKSLQEDFFLIIYMIILLVVCNLLLFTDIPLIENPTNINFNIFIIKSFKRFICNFIFSISFSLSLYSFYDMINATAILIKNYNKNFK